MNEWTRTFFSKSVKMTIHRLVICTTPNTIPKYSIAVIKPASATSAAGTNPNKNIKNTVHFQDEQVTPSQSETTRAINAVVKGT